MDSPPAKRRRTSPRLSARNSVEAGDAPPDNNANTTPPTAQSDPPVPSASRIPRPSFASPTRASLARHNPTILGKRDSPTRSQSVANGDDAVVDAQPGESGAETQRGTSKEKDREATRPLSQPPMRSPHRSPARSASPTRPLAQPAVRSPTRRSSSRIPSRSPTRRLFGSTAGGGGGLFSAPPQQSPKATRQRSQQMGSGPGSVPGSMLGAPPRRSPMKPVPRPLPPPDPQRSEDVLEPLIAREKRLRSGLDLFRVHEEPPPEPELPPTPEHPDPELLTSPPGIHQSSTPSKRATRASRLRRAKNTNSSSSPLKQPPMKPAATAASPERPATETGGRKGPTRNTNALREVDANIQRSGPRRSRKSDVARNVQPPDPDAAKKKERDAVLAEIAALEADLELAAAENSRIREAIARNDGGDITAAPNASAIISLLRRRALPEGDDDDGSDEAKAELAATNWLQAATNPIAFLPFGKPRSDLAELTQLFQYGKVGGDDEELPLPVSHHPIEMAAAEELPFLQAFSPLAFDSQIVILPPESSSASATAPLLQKHIITAASTTPPGVFLARVEMTVQTKSLRITDLQVPRIEPPGAMLELQSLFDRVTGSLSDASRNGSSDSALVRNVTVLSWAMGEWVRVAVRRAKFWAVLARLLADKGAGLAESIRNLRNEKKRKRKQSSLSRRSDSGSENEDEEASGRPAGPSPVSQAELLQHLDRTAMDVEIPLLQQNGSGDGSMQSLSSMSASGIRVEWSIDFDWTGEARSKIGVLVGVPGKWRKADKKGRLAGLPKLFHQLVQGNGDPLTAVQTVVALLAGDGEL